MKILKVLLSIFLTLFTLVLIFSIYAYFSPKPTAMLVRWAFSQSEYTAHEDIVEINSRVNVSEITYESTAKTNKLDLILPNNVDVNTKLPVILWVHGGAFVAGDKIDTLNYLKILADQGYAVVNMNYELAPSAKFPSPLIQMNEVYKHLKDNAATYVNLDLDKLIIGGDSAGAHIAAQFIITQTNGSYANTIGVSQTVPKETIIASLLYCGPYNFETLKNLLSVHTDKWIIDQLIHFIVRRVGYAYLGEMKWDKNDDFKVLTLKDYVTSDFPPTFITDGKVISFEDQGREFAETLRNTGVDVTEVYYDAELAHEYQFDFKEHKDGINYAMLTLNETFEFLNTVIN